MLTKKILFDIMKTIYSIEVQIGVCWYVSTNQSECFAPLFQKREPSGLSEKTPFLFCKAFFFVAIMPKKKASIKS